MSAYGVVYSCVSKGLIPHLRIQSVRAMKMYFKLELMCESW